MFRKAVFPIVCASWFAAGAILCLEAQQPRAVAHVLDVKGEWRVEGASGQVAAGEALNAGARIVAISGRPGDAITILHDEDMSRQHVACDASASNPCRNPVAIGDPSSGEVSGSNQLKVMMQAAFAVLLGNPPAIASHYALTLSRGSDSVREMEGVAALNPGQGIVMPTPPEDMPAGIYTVSVAHAGEPASTAEKTQLTSEGAWRPLPIEATGLYELTIANADQEKVADLMLLVTAQANYQAEQDRFAAMKKGTADWTGPEARADRHLLLRTFLLSESRP